MTTHHPETGTTNVNITDLLKLAAGLGIPVARCQHGGIVVHEPPEPGQDSGFSHGPSDLGQICFPPSPRSLSEKRSEAPGNGSDGAAEPGNRLDLSGMQGIARKRRRSARGVRRG